MLPYLLAVPLMAFMTFFLMAQAFPERVYRRIANVLALIPAAIWAAFGLASSTPALIIALSLGLGLTVWLLARAAGWIVYRRKS